MFEEPTLLLQHGHPISKDMEREHVDVEEIEMAAREHGIADLSEVAAAVLEIDGSISIIRKKGGGYHRSRRRTRQLTKRA